MSNKMLARKILTPPAPTPATPLDAHTRGGLLLYTRLALRFVCDDSDANTPHKTRHTI